MHWKHLDGLIIYTLDSGFGKMDVCYCPSSLIHIHTKLMHYALQVLSQSFINLLAQFRNLCTQSWCGCFPNIQEFYLEVCLNSLLCLEVFLSHFILWNIIYPLIYSTSFYYQPPTSLQIQTQRILTEPHIIHFFKMTFTTQAPAAFNVCDV